MTVRSLTRARAFLVLAAFAPGLAFAQSAGWSQRSAPVSDVLYDVTYSERTAQNRFIHVDMSFRTQGDGAVILSLPAWTPGSYELDNFARYITNFSAAAAGQPIRWDKTDFDTWRVFAKRAQQVTVSFDYRADTLDTGMAGSRPDFAYFNGTNVFFYPEGQSLEFPSRIAFHT